MLAWTQVLGEQAESGQRKNAATKNGRSVACTTADSEFRNTSGRLCEYKQRRPTFHTVRTYNPHSLSVVNSALIFTYGGRVKLQRARTLKTNLTKSQIKQGHCSSSFVS
jgi:hypothetical protein